MTAGGVAAASEVVPTDLGPDAIDTIVVEVSDLHWRDLSEAVRHQAARVFADTVGAMLGAGAQREILAMAGDAPAQPVASGNAQLCTPGQPWTTPGEAALVNGTAAVFLELDECAEGNGGHAAAHVVPVALSVAQSVGCSGTQLLTAVVAGYEVAARVGQLHRWHPAVHGHGHAGAIGGAVAAALLTGENPVAVARIAGNLPLASVQHMCLAGATARDAWTGVSATLALLASRLARAGFTGSAAARAVALGEVLGSVVDGRPADPSHRSRRPDDFQIMRSSVKFYSACFETHAAIEAASRHGRVSPSAVSSIRVEMPEPCLTDLPNGTPLSNRFSVPYAVATTLIHGRADPAAFGYDRQVMALAEKVQVVSADLPQLTRRSLDSPPAQVVLDFTDGTSATRFTELPAGHFPDRPDDDRLAAKFAELAGPAGIAEPGALFGRLIGVSDRTDLSTLLGGEPVDA